MSKSKQPAPVENVQLGKEVDAVAAIYAKIAAAEKKVNILKEQRDAAINALLIQFNNAGAQSVKGKKALAYITRTATANPIPEKWAELESYVYKHKALDLFQRRLSVTAAKDRAEAGEDLSKFIEFGTRVGLSIKPNSK